jgi:HEAT repeat protein
MTKTATMTIAAIIAGISGTACANPGDAQHIDIQFPTNGIPAAPKPIRTISIQEMLESGPPQLKMHSLSLIAGGSLTLPIDDSFLPGLKACATDPMPPVRSLAAKVLGQCFVADRDQPNPEVVGLLVELAKDPLDDVRYNAVHHGLCRIKNKDDQLVGLLIDIGAEVRQSSLLDSIAKGLAGNREQAAKILDQRLAKSDNAAYFEIYETIVGTPPANIDKYLDMPSSRPRMFIFAKASNNAEKDKAELTEELKSVGITNPNVVVSNVGGDNFVLMVKTYIIKEGMAVEKNFSDKGKFKIMQQMWLTPELEIQMDALRSAN